MDHLQAYRWPAQIPYISDWMPLPVTEQEPILHPAAPSSYENAEHSDKYDIIILLPCDIGFGVKLMLTHISTVLIQTTLVLKFLFEMMMMMMIYLFFKTISAFCKSRPTTSCWSFWTKSRKKSLLSSWVEVIWYYFKIKAIVKQIPSERLHNLICDYLLLLHLALEMGLKVNHNLLIEVLKQLSAKINK